MSFEKEIKCLDHGYVKYIDHMGSDESVIEAARMSTGRGFEGWEKDAKLLEFLYGNKHATPFEMCELAIEVQAPIFVFREWHRHRTQSYNEFSARYAQMPNLHYVPEVERIQKQSTTNKQGSAEPLDVAVAYDVVDGLGREQQAIYGHYQGLCDLGIAKEVARINTPVSRYSKMRAKTDLRNWLAFANLRARLNAQHEIRAFAIAVLEIVEALFPRTYELFLKHDLFAVSFSEDEVEALVVLIQTGDSAGIPDSVHKKIKAWQQLTAAFQRG